VFELKEKFLPEKLYFGSKFDILFLKIRNLRIPVEIIKRVPE